MTIDIAVENHEKEIIEELRQRMKGKMKKDMYEDIYLFYRFLKDRSFNIDKAEDMLRKHLEWREKNDVDNILSFKKPEVMEKYFPTMIIGHDKDGCPIRYYPVGNYDFIGLTASCRSEDIVKGIIYELETDTKELKRQSVKLGKNVDQIVHIYNFENLSFTQCTDKKVLYYNVIMLSQFQNNYPERLKVAYFINLPSFFSIIFSMVKPFLETHLIDRFKIFSDDSYKEELLKIIDDDVLPAFLGGTRTDPDGNPQCHSIIQHGEPIPETYYIHRSKRSLSKLPGVKKVTLPRAAFHEIILEVKEPNSHLEWEFETKCRDIGFGLFYQEIIDGEETNTELIPIHRIDTDNYAESGVYKCKKVGLYVMVFDNTYSWIRGKELFYHYKIVIPTEYEAETEF